MLSHTSTTTRAPLGESSGGVVVAVAVAVAVTVFAWAWSKRNQQQKPRLVASVAKLARVALATATPAGPAAPAAATVEFDYIIVGGGTAGCVVASRLSEDPSVSVLLIEAGPEGLVPTVAVPATVVHLFGSKFDWSYTTERQVHTKNRLHNWPRARVLGGCSATNALLYVRGSPADYDEWETVHGCKGWNWKKVEPLFVKTEGCKLGRDVVDEVNLCRNGKPHWLAEVFVKAAASIGFGHGPDGTISHRPMTYDRATGVDYNGKSQFGASIPQVTMHDGVRFSTYRAFCQPLLEVGSSQYRDNLTVLTGHVVTKLEIVQATGAGKLLSVSGVQVQQGEGRPCSFIKARKEVIVSSGAIGSPHLLMLSGIGPKQQLAEHGIDAIADLPGVGSNLQDHFVVPLLYRDTSHSLIEATASKIIPAAAEYALFRTGPLSSGGCEALAFFNTSGKRRGGDQRGGPNMQLHLMPVNPNEDFWQGKADMNLGVHKFVTLATLLHPFSRGAVRLVDGSPWVKPAVDPRYLADARDVAAVVDGFVEGREVLEAMRKADPRVGGEVAVESVVRELWRIRNGIAAGSKGDRAPTEAERRELMATREYVEEVVRRTGMTIYHPVGTCKMGDPSDPETVVSSLDLKVKGFVNLRVADASVMPVVPSGNTNASSIMIGEAVSEMIKGRW
ncbi:hypothetical protein DFJ73DRAFT_765096 [Zopfochytrium polystomum]|nr:hypothetical protein DFJ73DRAFT_765096 [Zopfochytrium polystomum]